MVHRRPRSREVLQARGHLGGLLNGRLPEDHPDIIAARARLKAANDRADLTGYVDQVVTNWPRLDDEQRRRIAELLDGGGLK